MVVVVMMLQVDRHHIAEWSRRLGKCLHGGAIRQGNAWSLSLGVAPTITPELVSGSVFFSAWPGEFGDGDER
jgi:hypothetical protein